MLHILLYIIIPSLLYTEPSEEHFYSTSGHVALRMQCPELGTDFVYDYVGDNLDRPIIAYLTGDLKMGLQLMPTDEFLAYEGRPSVDYPLQLNDTMILALCNILDKEYRRGFVKPYDPFQGSCSEMIVQYIHQAAVCTHTREDYHFAPADDLPFREMCLHYMHNNKVAYWIYGICFHKYLPKHDWPKLKKVVFPEQLLYLFQHSTLNDRPILKENAQK